MAPRSGQQTGQNVRMGDEQPPQRIGDAERDRATEFLREHLAQGRLDQAEFDERLEAALSAKVESDLDPLFQDLPAPTPHYPGSALTSATAGAAPPAQRREPGLPRRTRQAFDIGIWALWPIAIAACFAIGWQYWWLIFLPMVASGMWERKKEQDRVERRRYRKQLENERRTGPEER